MILCSTTSNATPAPATATDAHTAVAKEPMPAVTRSPSNFAGNGWLVAIDNTSASTQHHE
jgi:hypothetical protein